ncbi:choice-of-anchor D domain-containing protein [Catellatospora coxensis]
MQRETTTDTAGGFQNIGFIEDGDYWSYTPVNLRNITSARFRVASPGSGGRIEVRTGAPNGTLLGTATFGGTGGWQTFTDVTATLSASTTTAPLYLVAKNPAGDTGQGSIFNVNWVDFLGQGVADGSQLQITPGSLAFGSANVGTTTAAQTVTVSNPGTAAASIGSVTVSGQYTQTSTCGSSLAAGASCTMSVRFAPTAAGAQNGTLSVPNSTTASPLTVSLTGTGVSATTNLAIGAAMSASSSNGGFPASAANDDNTGSYWESNNNAFPQWLQADLGSAKQVSSVTLKLPPPSAWGARTQTLSISGSTDGTNFSTLKASAGYLFDPAAGNTATATFTTASVRYLRVTITANTGWPASQVAELQIFGGGSPPGSATLAANPTSVAFGSQNVGTTSGGSTVTITNTGTAAASISAVSASSQFAASGCTGTLNAGASCTVTVTFSPTSAGAKTGTLTVASNASNPSLTVNLTGTGTTVQTPATLSANPASIAYPNTNVGSTVTRTTQISNTGGTTASISSVTVSGTGFSLSANGCGSALAPGANCTVTVAFAPTSAGGKTGTLTVASSASNPSLAVGLTGTGTTVTSSNLALGKPVTAGHVQNYVPGNAVDGDANSYWESPNNAFPQSITVDLGGSASLSSIVLKLPSAWGARTQTLSVLGSTNGSTFTTIVGSAAYQFTPSGNTVTITLPANTTARHVRLTFTANTGWPAAQLSDFQVIGAPA